MKKKLKRLLLSERGDSSYISSFVYILVAVVLIAFIINVFHIISTKQEMDHMADQLVKQIQLNGGTSGETDSLFSFLSSEISGVEGLSYQVSGPGNTGRIQIAHPFTLPSRGAATLADSGNSTSFPSTSAPRGPASANITGNKEACHVQEDHPE